MDEALTVPEVCLAMKISRAQYYKLRKEKRFPVEPIHPPIDSRPRYSRVAIERVLASRIERPVLSRGVQ